MIRSRFQHSFVIQSTLQSYLVGFCVVLCSALQLQSSSTMLLLFLCKESEVCTRTGYELYELLFVSLSVRSFSACLGILGRFKVSFCSMKMALVNKLEFLCPVFESDHPEAQKKPVFLSLGC